MKTVLTGNTKGGQGKTCLTYNFAICALLEGLKVAVVDADGPQNTLFKNFKVRKDLQPSRKQPEMRALKETAKNSLRDELVDLRGGGFDIVFVDVGGHHSTGIFDAAFYANLWIIPAEPTMENFWGIEDSLQVKMDGAIRVLPNRVPLKATPVLKRVFADASKKLPMMKSKIHVRPFIPTADMY